MGPGEGLDPVDYLDRFFEEIRREARDNPAFAHRLVTALGATVAFDAGQKPDLLNPLIVASEAGADGVRAQFASLSARDLKAMLKSYNLASSIDMRGHDGPELLDLLARRSAEKAGERRST